MADCSGVHHDPDGPVVVTADVPLADVRAALGAGRWLQRPGEVAGWALLVTRDTDLAVGVEEQGVPAIIAGDDDALAQQLRAFDDGALISTREAAALAWIDAIRAEEERNQRDRRRLADERVEVLQARVDELESQLAAIEAGRSWKLARRMVSMKERLARTSRPRRH